MGMGAAIAGGMAVSSIATGVMSSNAAKSAASAQAAAANRAADLQEQQQAQTRADLLPYNTEGQNALTSLGNQLPALTASFQPTQAQLEQTPGYQFNLNQGLQGVQNAASAKGLGISGAALKGAASYATGLANGTYLDQANLYYTGQNNAYNKLMGTANLGENAAAQTGQQGTQAALNAGNNITSAGNATAAGIMGSNNAITGSINSLASAPMNMLMMGGMFGGSGGGSSMNPGTTRATAVNGGLGGLY